MTIGVFQYVELEPSYVRTLAKRRKLTARDVTIRKQHEEWFGGKVRPTGTMIEWRTSAGHQFVEMLRQEFGLRKAGY